MLHKKLRKQLKEFDPVNHPECSHNWIHYAGMQCEWDCWDFADSCKGIRPEEFKKDSKRIANIYICTMCGGTYWSSTKDQKVQHYWVRERRNKCQIMNTL